MEGIETIERFLDAQKKLNDQLASDEFTPAGGVKNITEITGRTETPEYAEFFELYSEERDSIRNYDRTQKTKVVDLMLELVEVVMDVYQVATRRDVASETRDFQGIRLESLEILQLSFNLLNDFESEIIIEKRERLEALIRRGRIELPETSEAQVAAIWLGEELERKRTPPPKKPTPAQGINLDLKTGRE
ncbi:hypothetical protein HZC07_05600, partial [Candidatus Micrarchaeota archaeon]|nr:hypothetical protein [Candidatus Micrarchaeota archaeon]